MATKEETKKVKTVQIGNKLIIANGVDPLRYVDLATNKVHVYKEHKPFTFYYRIKSLIKKDKS